MKSAQVDLLRNQNTPESRAQLREAMADPELMRYTIEGELHSIGVLDRAVVAQIVEPFISAAADFAPIGGDYKAFHEAQDSFDYAMAMVGLTLILGDLAGKGVKTVQALLKEGKTAEAVDLLRDLLKNSPGSAKESVDSVVKLSQGHHGRITQAGTDT